LNVSLQGTGQVSTATFAPSLWLGFAAANSHTSFNKLLLQLLRGKIINANSITESNEPLLLWAAEEGFEDLVEHLLAVSFYSNGGQVLVSAAQNGHERIVRLLLSSVGIDLNLEIFYGKSALLRAATSGHEEVVKQLIYSSQMRAFLDSGFISEVLTDAAGDGHEGVVKAVLASGTSYTNMSSSLG
jgi:hypothetical protein